MLKVHEVRSTQATKNLRRKLAALAHYAKAGIPWVCDANGQVVRSAETGARALDFFPKNPRQFSRWTTERGKAKGLCNCDTAIQDLVKRVGHFTTHGIDSLKKRDGDLALAQGLLKALRAKAVEQEADENYADKIKKLVLMNASLEAAAEAEAGFVVKELMENQSLRNKVADLERALESARQELAIQDAVAQARLHDSEKLVAKLRKQISESDRFRRVGEQ